MTDTKVLMKSSPWQLRLGERRALLFIGDFFMALIALGASLYLWGSRLRFVELNRLVPQWFYVLPLIWVLLLIELYDVHRAGSWRDTVRGIATAALAGLGLYLLYYFLYVESPDTLLPRRSVATFLVLVSALTFGWRGLYIRIFSTPRFLRRVLLVGGGKTGELMLKIINDLNPTPFYMVGVIDDDPEKAGSQIDSLKVIGTSSCLLSTIREEAVSDIIVAISGELQGSMFQALLDAQELGVEITRMPVAYEELLGRVPIRLLEADWILRSFVDQARVSTFYMLGKRLLDIAGGFVGSMIFLVSLPVIGVMILLDDGWPIIYAQTRSGRGGQPYSILKYRTMSNDAEADGKPQWAKEDDERATRVGRLLRKTHLDELPQFLNVLRGEMSLVGPRAERPELVEMFQRHVPFYRARLLVKPGITGWAQVNFGYASTVDETITKLEYDLYYIKHRNLLMDMVILLRTPATMFGFRGR